MKGAVATIGGWVLIVAVVFVVNVVRFAQRRSEGTDWVPEPPGMIPENLCRSALW